MKIDTRHPVYVVAFAAVSALVLTGLIMALHAAAQSRITLNEQAMRQGAIVEILFVEPGDTLAALAERFGLEARTIVWANDALAASPTLRVGQELVILPVDGIYHTVAPGETVERVAAKYGVDAARIRAFPGNGLAEGEALEVGQGLVLPGALPGYRAGGGGLPFLPTPELPEGAAEGTGSMVWPLTGMLSQGYWEGHPAIDIAAPAGTPATPGRQTIVCCGHFPAIASFSSGLA